MAKGEQALWQVGRPMGWAGHPTFVAVWPKLRRGVFWNLLELYFTVFKRVESLVVIDLFVWSV